MNKLGTLAVVSIVVSAACVAATAQIHKGKTRLALTKQIMVGLVHPNYSAIEKLAKDIPANEKAWDTLATNAALLNEASHLLMDDGRCPDANWEKAAQQLRKGSGAVLAKIEAKDAASVVIELKAMTQACVACHAAHKD